MVDTPITLESINLTTWEQLYELEPAEILRRMSKHNVPVHAGDAFLAVLVVRSVSDLIAGTKRLENGTKPVYGRPDGTFGADLGGRVHCAV